ncbi:MAG: phosphoribosyltransferase [Cyanobium sp. MAG06]|nr:phosphoribosyltransferase [Cyanobium sp. MAG06]
MDLLIEKFEKADLINRDTVFIGVERGGIFPKDRLSRKYSENKTNYATMKTRAYHSDNNSLKDGKVYIDPNIIGKESVLKAKNIVILDDLIDTGITFIELKKYLTILNPNAKIITAAVLEKPQLKLKSRLKPDIYGVKLQEN